MTPTSPAREELIALAAGRILARAALDAFALASRAGEHAPLAYDLLDLDEYQLSGSNELRVGLICEKLRQLLAGGEPNVAWEDAEAIMQDRLRGVHERLRRAALRRSAQGVAPAPVQQSARS